MDYNIIKGKSVLSNMLDAYTGSMLPLYTDYTDNGIYLCKSSATNTTTTPTLDINAIGAKTIYKINGSAISVGDILLNGWYLFMYDSGLNGFIKLN